MVLPLDDKIKQSYIGTALFMAPEKNHQEQKIDYKKPDVYSLGVTMYFMLFGKYVNMSINNALSRKD